MKQTTRLATTLILIGVCACSPQVEGNNPSEDDVVSDAGADNDSGEDATVSPEPDATVEDAAPDTLTPNNCLYPTDCPSGLSCNRFDGQCVACRTSLECDEGKLCVEGRCEMTDACNNDIDCLQAGMVCDETDGRCVPCVEVADCGDEFACIDRSCVATRACESSLDCQDISKLCLRGPSEDWPRDPWQWCQDCGADEDCQEGEVCREGLCARVCDGPGCVMPYVAVIVEDANFNPDDYGGPFIDAVSFSYSEEFWTNEEIFASEVLEYNGEPYEDYNDPNNVLGPFDSNCETRFTKWVTIKGGNLTVSFDKHMYEGAIITVYEIGDTICSQLGVNDRFRDVPYRVSVMDALGRVEELGESSPGIIQHKLNNQNQ